MAGVVGVAGEDGEGAVDLFGEDGAGELVGEGDGAEGEDEGGAGAGGGGPAVGGADGEDDGLGAGVAQAAEVGGEVFGGELLPRLSSRIRMGAVRVGWRSSAARRAASVE